MIKVSLADTVGKKVSRIYENYDSDVFILFSDNTYAYLKAEESYGSTILTEHHDTLSRSTRVELGMMTKKEADAEEKAEKDKTEQTRREWELKQLAELKKKYES